MKKLFIISLLLLLTTIPSHAQQSGNRKVKFVLKAPHVPEGSTVYITGNTPQLGNWNPGKVAMKQTGQDTWSITVKVPLHAELEYKYTLGSWKREAVDEKGVKLPNFRVSVNKTTTIENIVTNWLNMEPHSNKEKEGITGTVEYHEAMKAAGLKERDLIVWLPPGYKQDDETKYPVLYMHDGQNVFDPETSSFGVEWQLDETSDSLIKEDAIEPLIIVGINNTPDRSEEYVPGKKGDAYMNFVVNKVKPFIDKQYRTKTDRENTAVGGSSAGGIMAFMLAWKYPEVFSKAICMSPAFKIEHIDFVKEVKAYTGAKKDLFFYIDNGGIELEERLQPGITEMLKTLREKGYTEQEDFVWIKAENDPHSEAAWARRMPVALKLLFPRKETAD